MFSSRPAILALAAWTAATPLTAPAQFTPPDCQPTDFGLGTVFFCTRISGKVDAPVYDADGLVPVAGPGYSAQLYGGLQGAAESALQPACPMSYFRTGATAGYTVVPLENAYIPGTFPSGMAKVQLRAWDNQSGTIISYEQAVAAGVKAGKSTPILIGPLGGGISPPADLIGLQSFLIGTPPTISAHPVNRTRAPGGSVTFSVTAGGSPAPAYQWRRDGSPIEGATNASLTLTNLQFDQAANYDVLLVNSFGAITSQVATLLVKLCEDSASGLVAWWSGDGHFLDLADHNDGAGVGGMGFAAGKVGPAFQFNGTDADILVPASASLDVGAGAGLTVELWLNPQDALASAPLVEWQETIPNRNGPHLWMWGGALSANLMDTSGNAHVFASTVVLESGFQHVALTYDKNTSQGTLYRNGQVVAASNLGVFTPDTRNLVHLGLRAAGDAYVGYRFAGWMDEVSIYNRALSAGEIDTIYQADAGGRCKAPIISAPPASQVRGLGGNATLNVSAAGTATLTYQWRKDGDNIEGATTATLTIGGIQPAAAGDYDVVVANTIGAVTSQVATLSIANRAAQPSGLVSWWPANGNANDFIGPNNGRLNQGAGFAPGVFGQAFSLDGVDDYVATPVAGMNVGTGDFTVDGWLKTLTTKTYSAIGSFDTYSPGLYVRGDLGGALQLWPLSPSTLGGFNDGQWHHFAFVRQGGSLIYYKDGVAAGSAPYAEALNPSQFLIGWDLYAGEQFPGLLDEVDFAGRALGASEIEALYAAGNAVITRPPVVLTPPQSQTVLLGDTVVLSFVASGLTPRSYQWRFNGAPLPGESNPTLSLQGVVLGQAGGYDVVIANAHGSITSAVAILTVQLVAQDQVLDTREDLATVITLGSPTNPAGGPITYTVVANPGHGTLSGTGHLLTYTPAPNYNGRDTFTFEAWDGGNLLGQGTVTLNIAFEDDVKLYVFMPATNFPTGASPQGLVAGDFKKDAKLDLAVANHDGNSVSILTNNGLGVFTVGANVTGIQTPAGLAAADFTKDLKLDLAVITEAQQLIVLRGDDTGNFTTNPARDLGFYPSAVAAGLLNKDTKPDLAILGNGGVNLLYGVGDGTFSNTVNFPIANQALLNLAVGDFNRDRKLDLAVVGMDKVSVLLNNGSGAFTNVAQYPVGVYAYHLAAGDVNGDTNVDLVTANYGEGTVSVLLGSANGQLGAATNFEVGPYPYAVTIADFNRDAKPDLAVALADGLLVVLIGNGDGSFDYYYGDAATTYVVGQGEKALAVGDFNKDKNLDLAVLNADSDDVSILLNNYAPRAYGQKLTVNEDSTTPITLVGLYGALDYVIVRGPTNGTYTTTSAFSNTTVNPVLQYTPFPNAFGADLIDFYVSDGDNVSKTVRITIKILPVNDAPSFALAAERIEVAEDCGTYKYTNFAFNIDKGAANEASQTLQFLVTFLDDAQTNLFNGKVGLPKLSSKGVLSFTPAKNASGNADLKIQLRDSGGTAYGGDNLSDEQFFAVTITNVNDPPTITKPMGKTILEDQTATFSLTVGDLETAAGALVVTAGSSNVVLVPVDNIDITVNPTNPALRDVLVTPVANVYGKTLLTFTVSDGTNRASSSVLLTVNPVNDPPSFTLDPALTSLTVPQKSAYSNLVVSAMSAGAGESGQAMSFLVVNTNLSLFLTQPKINAQGYLSFKTKAVTTATSVTLAVSLKDAGLPPITVGPQQIVITVQP